MQLKCIDPDGHEVPNGEPGELVASGPGVMRGYWQRPEETSEVLYEENNEIWFKTGDRCVMEADGHVRVVGRVKELYKLANGKYVAPAPPKIRARSRFIAQAFVYGENKEHNVCLVAPDWVNVANKFGVSGVTMPAPFTFEPREKIEELLENHRTEIVHLMEAEVDYHGSKFKSFEKPERVGVVSEGACGANGHAETVGEAGGGAGRAPARHRRALRRRRGRGRGGLGRALLPSLLRVTVRLCSTSSCFALRV